MGTRQMDDIPEMNENNATVHSEKNVEDLWIETNRKYLDIYESDMKAAGRSKKTISKNIDNADTYINYFLMRLIEETQSIQSYKIEDENRGVLEDGCRKIGYYISYYYLHKDLSATPYNLKVTVKSIQDFYACMYEHGIVSKEGYELLCFEIESDLDMWVEECKVLCRKVSGEE